MIFFKLEKVSSQAWRVYSACMHACLPILHYCVNDHEVPKLVSAYLGQAFGRVVTGYTARAGVPDSHNREHWMQRGNL